MSALKEMLRVIGAWEDDFRYVAIGLRSDDRHLRFARGTAQPYRLFAVRGMVEQVGHVESIKEDASRLMMSPEDVRAELRWLSMGSES